MIKTSICTLKVKYNHINIELFVHSKFSKSKYLSNILYFLQDNVI